MIMAKHLRQQQLNSITDKKMPSADNNLGNRENQMQLFSFNYFLSMLS